MGRYCGVGDEPGVGAIGACILAFGGFRGITVGVAKGRGKRFCGVLVCGGVVG